jgi:hypothetical protein
MRTIIEVAVHYKQINPIFGEGVTHVRIDDEAAGGFIVLKQDDKELRFDLEELEEVIIAARELLAQYDTGIAE